MLADTYITNSLIPKRYQADISLHPCTKDIKTFNELKDIYDNIKEFVDKGKNLLLCSNNAGNGKTTVATKLLKEYIHQVSDRSFKYNCPALFINVGNFLNEKKMAISDPDITEKIREIERCILSAKLVVFDDIGDKNLSPYDLSLLYYWIDTRTSDMKSCIYTTNQLPKQLEKTFDGKLYSRIVNYSEVKVFTDGDHRGAQN